MLSIFSKIAILNTHLFLNAEVKTLFLCIFTWYIFCMQKKILISLICSAFLFFGVSLAQLEGF